MNEPMVTFDNSSWIYKGKAFYDWNLDNLVTAILRHPLKAEHVMNFYKCNVHIFSYGESLDLVAQNANRQVFSKHGFFDITVPLGLFKDEQVQAMARLCGHAFYRAGLEHEELIENIVTSTLYDDGDTGYKFRSFVHRMRESIPEQRVRTTGELMPFDVTADRMMRGFSVNYGRKNDYISKKKSKKRKSDLAIVFRHE